MTFPPRPRPGRRSFAAVGFLLFAGLLVHAQPSCPLTLDRLQAMTPCELATLFDRAEVGNPPVGQLEGRLLYLTDPRGAKLKVRLSNAVWRGKMTTADGYFVNRWIGGINRIDSHYVVGPSWVDGRPAVLMEYPAGTKLFWNMHDELREIAPGLYMGPVFDRFPCPKFRGFIALQVECCQPRCR